MTLDVRWIEDTMTSDIFKRAHRHRTVLTTTVTESAFINQGKYSSSGTVQRGSWKCLLPATWVATRGRVHDRRFLLREHTYPSPGSCSLGLIFHMLDWLRAVFVSLSNPVFQIRSRVRKRVVANAKICSSCQKIRQGS